MAQNYRNQSTRPESSRGGRYQTGSERDRYRTGGEQRYNPDRGERGGRSFEGDRSYSQGGYSEEFGYQRGRNREDFNDRSQGARSYGSRGSSGANHQSGRSYGGDYDREGQSRYDEGRFDEGNRWSEAADDRDYGNRDVGGSEFTFARNRGTSTSRWREDLGEGGGYFDTGNYIDDGGAWRGFGRDFDRARARVQQENDFGSYRDENRETSGDYRNYGRSQYGAQANYGRDEDESPWQRQQRGSYEDRSSWDYGGQRAGSGSSGGAYGRSGGSYYGSSSGRSSSGMGSSSGMESFRGRGPKGYQRSDERLKEMICERLTDDPQIDASNVTIEVKDQVVKLTGTVDDRSTKYEIEELVEHCGSVKDIDNQLRVQSSRSSFGQSSQTQTGQQTQSGQQGRNDWEAGSSTTSGSGRETRSSSGTSATGSSTNTPSSGSTGRKN